LNLSANTGLINPLEEKPSSSGKKRYFYLLIKRRGGKANQKRLISAGGTSGKLGRAEIRPEEGKNYKKTFLV